MSAEIHNRWSRYANFYLLRACLQRGGICDYDVTDEDRNRWIRSRTLPKPQNPERLRAVLAAKHEVVRDATYAHSIGDPWSNEDFEDVLRHAIESALNGDPARPKEAAPA